MPLLLIPVSSEGVELYVGGGELLNQCTKIGASLVKAVTSSDQIQPYLLNRSLMTPKSYSYENTESKLLKDDE